MMRKEWDYCVRKIIRKTKIYLLKLPQTYVYKGLKNYSSENFANVLNMRPQMKVAVFKFSMHLLRRQHILCV